ncbi:MULTISPECIES: collagen-like protein [Streptomyces]|uniref:Collagen-like protein n=1 Tax=Streptomyces parvulus TaxID=146923 RepID=A0A369VA76_9ACTN|nr:MULTISPECIES: collagen-like protein [Streptomyces]MCM1973760.1 collagen-like protein [Streptomyces sp. G1]RDD89095.1 collagen-like protein [Streptomyces parvulus]
MLPEGIPTVRVTGRFLTPEGKPLAGQVIFRAPGMVTFGEFDVILGGPVAAPLDSTGAFEVVLPATDAPGMIPTDWSYAVAEQLAGVPMNRTYQVLLPAETPAVDLADIAPTDPTTPNYVAVRGDSAYEVAVEAGFVGTVEQWLASLIGPRGDTGATGQTGPAGDDAYEVAVAAGFVGDRAAWLASLVGPRGATGETGEQGPPGTNGADGAPGVVQSVNGQSTAAVVLDAADVGAVPDTAPGAAGGVAQLDETGKVPAAQLPALSGGGTVQTVAGVSPDANGNVALVPADVGAATAAHTHTAAQVGALATTARAAANGVASLDASTRVPIAQLPAAAGRNMWTPQALGFAAWSCDPYTVANPVPKYLKPQRLFFVGFNITETTTVNRIVMFARGYGGVSTNRYRGAIYRDTGAKVVESGGVALTMAGQEAGSLPAMETNHVGAVPLTIASTSLAPGRYWAAWSLVTGGTADFAFFHVQNESPIATANFWMPGTPFARAWYTEGQTNAALPATVSQTAAGVLADHDIPIMALANV